MSLNADNSPHLFWETLNRTTVNVEGRYVVDKMYLNFMIHLNIFFLVSLKVCK